MRTKIKLIYLVINLILVGTLIYTYSIESGMYRNTVRLIFVLAIPVVSLC